MIIILMTILNIMINDDNDYNKYENANQKIENVD